MIVEHSFVTTLDHTDAFARANELLGPRGFQIEDGRRGQSQQWRRGVKDASYTRRTLRLPQGIRMLFDRGRVTLAASIDATGGHRRRAAELMVAYAESLEQLLVHQSPDAATEADRAERQTRISDAWRIVRLSLTVLLLLAGLSLAGYFGFQELDRARTEYRARRDGTRQVIPAYTQSTPRSQPRQPTDQPVLAPRGAGPEYFERLERRNSQPKAPPQITVRKSTPKSN